MTDNPAERINATLDMLPREQWDVVDETPFASAYPDDVVFVDGETGEEKTEYFFEYFWKLTHQEDVGDYYCLMRSKVTFDDQQYPVYETEEVRKYEYWQLFPDSVKFDILTDLVKQGVYA